MSFDFLTLCSAGFVGFVLGGYLGAKLGVRKGYKYGIWDANVQLAVMQQKMDMEEKLLFRRIIEKHRVDKGQKG